MRFQNPLAMERRLGLELGQMGARDERKASSSLSWLGRRDGTAPSQRRR
jgi:hypothetical protein